MKANLANIFAEKYATNEWTNGSGPGSFQALNLPLLRYLQTLIETERIRHLVDVGCGDFQLWDGFNFGKCRYTGLDVVTAVIAANQARLSRTGVRFEMMPEDLEALPRADLYLVKDVLIHLNNEASKALVDAACRNADFVVFVNNTTAGGGIYNRDIMVGGFRPVDVSLPPFNRIVRETLVYGAVSALDPRWPRFLAKLFRRFVWPGEKRVQIVLGDKLARLGRDALDAGRECRAADH